MSFQKWDGNLNKLFERLQESYGSSTEEYNHVLSSITQLLSSTSITWFNGVPYIQDPLRGKWLSTSRCLQEFNYRGQNQKSRYLKIGEVVGSGNGLLMMRKATITGLSTKSRSASNYSIEIRINDVVTPLYTLTASAGSGIADTLDVDVDAGDYVQLFMSVGAEDAVDHPLAFIEFAWRYEL